MSNISEDEFYEKYQPVRNHFDSNALFNGHMFKMYGREHEYIDITKNVLKKNIWTIIKSDSRMYITAGYYLVDRVGYLVTRIPWITGLEEVELDKKELTLFEAIDIVETGLKTYVENCLNKEVDNIKELQNAWDLIKIVVKNE